nr:MAG TPA: hypothetical protein [Caudoviricetes sp.]
MLIKPDTCNTVSGLIYMLDYPQTIPQLWHIQRNA